MICAGNITNDFWNMTCQGDSGGPLFRTSAAGSATQVGVVIWGSIRCTGKPGVYTSVAAERRWIDATIEELLRKHKGHGKQAWPCLAQASATRPPACTAA
ncbi:hypothetical protein ABPG75_013459 [Micractinium tetrahymenae]